MPKVFGPTQTPPIYLNFSIIVKDLILLIN